MNKTDLLSIRAILHYWEWKERRQQLAHEKRKAAIMRQIQRVREMQAEKERHILN